MAGSFFYDVTKCEFGDPYEDIGAVINRIIADVKQKQQCADHNDEGKPGAVIFVPSGDYHLRTQAVIDISYLKIMGTGHGFESSSVRFNVPKEAWHQQHELWPGGSRILNDLIPGDDKISGAAFYVARKGDPRISSVEFENFCIDGLHFTDDGNGDPENTYLNGKTGIYVATPHDSFRITAMCIIYHEHGVVTNCSDALSIHDNFIAECGNCIELRTAGQAAKITDNLLGAGYRGYSIFAENFGGLLVSSNNVFPRGKSSLHFSGVTRSSVSANRFHSFYPGMLIFENGCSENLVSSNHFLRDHEPWPPMYAYDNGETDDLGLLVISGTGNSILANHVSESIGRQYLKPAGVTPVIIRIKSGTDNMISNNHIVATTEAEVSAVPVKSNEELSKSSDSCFEAQVSALLNAHLVKLPVIAVKIDEGAEGNIVLDSARDGEVSIDRTKNTFRTY